VKKLEELNEKILACRKCPALIGQQERPIASDGSGKPRGIVVIGEAPGREEAKQLKIFVGRSGQLLRRAIKKAEIPEEIITFLNVLKCHPPENRDPTEKETANCRVWLEQQLQLLDPVIILSVGRVATGALQEKPPDAVPIMRIAGQPYKAGRYTCVPTMHPAYVLRRRGDRDLGLAFIGHLRIALGHYQRLKKENENGGDGTRG